MNYSKRNSTCVSFVHTAANLLFGCDDRTCPTGLQVMMRQRSALIFLLREREKKTHSYKGMKEV